MTDQKTYPIGTIRGPFDNTNPTAKLSKIYFMVQGPNGWKPVDGMQTKPTFERAAEMALGFLIESRTFSKPLIIPEAITPEDDSPEKGLTKGRKYRVRGDLVRGLYIFNDHYIKRYLRDEQGKVSNFSEYVNSTVPEEEEI